MSLGTESGPESLLRKVDYVRPMDIAAAIELVANDPVLKNDALTQEMIDNGFMNRKGEFVDPGDFLYCRREILDGNLNDEKLKEIMKRNKNAYDAAMVIATPAGARIVDDTDSKTIH